jgi:hypothetical protein
MTWIPMDYKMDFVDLSFVLVETVVNELWESDELGLEIRNLIEKKNLDDVEEVENHLNSVYMDCYTSCKLVAFSNFSFLKTKKVSHVDKNIYKVYKNDFF